MLVFVRSEGEESVENQERRRRRSGSSSSSKKVLLPAMWSHSFQVKDEHIWE